MIAPLSLSNLLTVMLALACLHTIAPQSRGGVVKLWRLALPPCFAAVEALVLLAGVFDASMSHDAEWVIAALLGAFLGRMRGWSMPVEVDRMWELVRLKPSFDGQLAALALVGWSAIDFTSASLEVPILACEHVAAGAALFAGYLSARALAIAVRAMRAPHVELQPNSRHGADFSA
jgi:hypothetical protein